MRYIEVESGLYYQTGTDEDGNAYSVQRSPAIAAVAWEYASAGTWEDITHKPGGVVYNAPADHLIVASVVPDETVDYIAANPAYQVYINEAR